MLPMRSMALFFPVGTAGDGKLRRSKAAEEETVCSWDEADSVVSKINAYALTEKPEACRYANQTHDRKSECKYCVNMLVSVGT